ncbi:MAG: hypothetical protein CME65_04175 [Halobacteriovoraceae bacterium]|nr:hypothetical protein [Halobacteriovoraceae bacterium]|tara:strand:- start:14891 stop:15448 length:558 start_codon:yes stop_codon:yes gene_type:complete
MENDFLDNLINEMREEDEKTSRVEAKKVAVQVKDLNKSWKSKYYNELIVVPLMYFGIVLHLIGSYSGAYLYLTLTPLFFLGIIMFMQIWFNYKTNQIDLSLDLTQYGERQKKIYKDQLILFFWLKLLVYPTLIGSIIYEFYFQITNNGDAWDYGAIVLKIVLLGGVRWFERSSVAEIKQILANLD